MIEYTCAICKETFVSDVPEFIKVVEAERNFGKCPEGEEANSLCDDCYKIFMKWYNEQRPDLRSS